LKIFLDVLITLSFILLFLTSCDSANQDEMIFFHEVIPKIQKRSIFLQDNTTTEEIAKNSIKAFLANFDSHSDFLSKDEYKTFKQSQQNSYIGIGMDIDKNSRGQLICYPHSKSPAEKAGILSGDILIDINGENIKQKSIYYVASKIRGKQNTSVKLLILSKSKKQKSVIVNRTKICSDAVTSSIIDQFLILHIKNFSSLTTIQLTTKMALLKEDQSLILDLRDNPGGDLYSAIDSLANFLIKKMLIVKIISRNNIKEYRCIGNSKRFNRQIFIWQNKFTASAAEIFIAALSFHINAITIGQQTYGKGTTQEIIEISDGSAMILTTGYLVTPQGIKYHQKGLKPDYLLSDNITETKEYYETVKKLAILKN